MKNGPANFHRAAWVQQALGKFVEETGNTTIGRLHPEDLSDAISDLICDLLHFANQSGLQPEHIIAQAQANYDADLMEALS